jgi:CzcA family heavy metal efflux pump
MIDALIRWSVANRLTVVALAVAFLVWGGYTISEMPLDVLPDLTAPTVTVLAEAPGMAPTEMESLVTFPIESALNGAAGVRRLRSATAVGIAVLWVEFEWGEDIYRARQTVTEKLSQVALSLPPDVKQPLLAPISSIMGEILFLTLESDRHSPVELRAVGENIVRRRLLSIPGVSQVIATGGAQKQYQVLVAPDRLQFYGLTLEDVERALHGASRNTSAGFRVTGGQEYLIQGLGRLRTEDEIGSVAIATRENTTVLVRDVARVQVGEALKRAEGSRNGRPALILGIQKQPGANTLELTRTIDIALDALEPTLPPGIRIDRHVFRQSDFIERALENLFAALRDGSLLVVLIVTIFLMNSRATLITLAALPLSVVAGVVGMKFFGITINTMSLGGLAIAIGELVDDAIIDVENVVRRLRENSGRPEAERLSPLDVVVKASSEIRGSVVFATLIVALVFVPLFFLEGVEGRLLQPLGTAYVISLMASLVVALTVTPALCSLLLPRAKSILRGHESWLVKPLKTAYLPTVRWAIDRAGLVFAVSGALLVIALASFWFMGRAFLPEFNEGTLTISAVTVPGTSLAESDALGRALEGVLLSVPEITSTARRTGRAELDEHVQGVESAEIDVTLKMEKRDKHEILEEIRRKVTLVPGTNVTIGQPISHRIDHMLSGTRANIAIKIFGEDLGILRALAEHVRSVVTDVAGVADLSVEQQTEIPTVRVKVDPTAAARHGLSSGRVTESLETAFLGKEVGQILEGERSVPLVVRYDVDGLQDVGVLERTFLDAPKGARVTFSAVAEVREDRGPNFIMREGVQRRLVVQCNVAGRDLRSVVDDIRARVQASVSLPRGYRIEYGGQFESEARASRRILLLGVGVVLGILLVLASGFHSFKDAVIIMLNLPLALVGGVVGVFVAGGVLSVASLVGFITLFGIATRNGIMMVSHIRHLIQNEGESDLREAVIRGALERMAPILMTALAAGLALIPVALGMGKPGSEIQAPMAIVILFGLFSSTALNMIVVPAAMGRFGSNSLIETGV